MRIETTKDILDHSIEFHKLISEYYHGLIEKSKKERIILLLKYLEEREKQLEKVLIQIEESTPSNVLKTWFPHSQCKNKFEELKLVLQDNDVTIEKIVDHFLNFDNCLIEVYTKLMESSDSPEVKEFFESLKQLEVNHKIKILKNISQMDSI